MRIDRLGPRVLFTFDDIEHMHEEVTVILHPRDVLAVKERDHEGYGCAVSLIKIRGEPQELILPIDKPMLLKLILLAEQHPNPSAFAKAVSPFVKTIMRSRASRHL